MKNPPVQGAPDLNSSQIIYRESQLIWVVGLIIDSKIQIDLHSWTYYYYQKSQLLWVQVINN